MTKLLHTSDLHIGKRMNEFSLDEDQRYILKNILEIIDTEKIDALLIAGDIYDSTTISGESMNILDDFLTSIAEVGCKAYLINGNHDSADKLSYGSRLMSDKGIHISRPFNGVAEKYTLNGTPDVDIYLLPFIKPAMVRRFYDNPVETYTDAVRVTLQHSDKSNNKKVILSHQFVTSGSQKPETSDSETISVGGLDNVDASVFSEFDYVALGHIHSPQSIGSDKIRYSGSPLKYSKSEAHRNKTVTIIEIDNDVKIREIPLKPLREVRVIKGPLDALISTGKEDTDKNDFIHAIITDANPIDAMSKLREVYPNTASIEVPVHEEELKIEILNAEKLDIIELFSKLYEEKIGEELTSTQIEIITEAYQEASE